MLALNKIINLIGGWTYKSKHDLDKDSDIITSSRNSKNSSSKSSNSSDKSTRIKYHKKARGTRYKKGSKTRSNKTRSKR